ncbi:glycosyltransferase [Actinotalea sp. BY-33]|uniref:Glycosyltransferase n=1 Tax=Actinotalea soli TaxID=2819234 RepID=A0A939LN42_9CELL|nr:glycosyltransferase [Actinotalea soli]MBO1750936.1 glycosyltransferase [Actinotalea soli]
MISPTRGDALEISSPPGTLSVVIPVYNEERWIRRCVAALADAAARAGLALDVVIVDDGSVDGTPEVLRDLSSQHDLRVVTQPNAGRLAARSTGLAAAREPWVLLLDSRVIAEPSGLAWVREQIASHPTRQVWCGHVDVDTDGNLFAAFWSGLVKIGWRRYTSAPRLVSFGAEDFDAYPKGTGCLLLPADLLREAVAGFDSLYDVPDLASDDTRLLRYVAERHRIWLSPDFAFRYFGKQGFRGFLRQSYFRGTTFVDGYLGHAGAVRRALITAVLGGVGLLALAARRPAWGATGMGVITAALATAVRRVGGTRDEVRAAAALTPVFAVVFGSGVVRGLLLAAAHAVRGARGPSPR